MAGALISLQQIPLELTQDKYLLDLIATGKGKWDQEIAGRLGPRNHWTLATGSGIAWVVLAFLFTLIDSFVSIIVDGDGVTEGHAVGTLWLWLLCLVTGWLWVPTFTRGEVKVVTGRANLKAVKRANVARTESTVSVGTESTYQLPTLEKLRQSSGIIPEVDEENANAGMGLTQENGRPAGQEIEQQANPHPDPASLPRPTLSPRSTTIGSQYSGISKRLTDAQSLNPPEGHLLLLKDDSLWLNRDELRHSPTFNYSRVMRYLVLVDKVFAALEKRDVSISRKRPILEVTSLILCRQGPGERCVSTRSVLLDVYSVVFRPRSPVRNCRRGYGNRGLHPYGRFEVPCSGIRNLRRDLYPHLVPHHRFNNIRPHRRNSQQTSRHRRQSPHIFHRHRPPLGQPHTRNCQRGGDYRVVWLAVLQLPRDLLLRLERHRKGGGYLYHH